MSIYRVVISFMRDRMQYMYERAALAMTPGEALDRTLIALNIEKSRIYSLKTWVNTPEDLKDFSRDAVIMPVIGSDTRLEDLWRRKHGDF